MKPRMLIAATALLTLAVLPVVAQAQGDATPTRVTISEPGRGAKGHLTLRATLVTEQGKPVSERSVNFYEQVAVFGARDALLGTATTDSTGFAAIDYQPAELGPQTIVARFAGDEQFASTQANLKIEVREIVPIYASAELPLATVRQWLPLGLGSLVLATWAVLIGITVRTIAGVRAAGRTTEPRLATARIAPEGRSS